MTHITEKGSKTTLIHSRCTTNMGEQVQFFIRSGAPLWTEKRNIFVQVILHIITENDIENNHHNGNFICVFECTIVNLATYRQFTNAA